MSLVRRAFMFSVTERYIVMGCNFLMVAIVARILTPAEFGFSVIGAATIAIVETFRDFGALSFIVQQKELARGDARTAATVMLLLSVALAGAVWLAASPLADFYQNGGLRPYLQVIAATLLAGPFSGPLMALLQRDMRFGDIAAVNVGSACTSAAVTLAAALAGASYMSFAWGAMSGAVMAAILAAALRPEFWIFIPTLKEWRTTLSFGGYWTATGFLNKVHDFAPALVLGHGLGFGPMGLFSRAVVVCELPDKCLLAGLTPIALPAMAAEARSGRGLKAAYLLSLTYITVVQWPALLLLALLAHPVVQVLYGDQWLAIVPLVQIITASLLVSFPTILAAPVLVAQGRVRDAFVATICTAPPGIAIIAVAASQGLEAAALSMSVTGVLQAGVWLCVIRRRIPFGWGELAASLRGSAQVTAGSLALPLLLLALNGFRQDVSVLEAVLVVIGAAAGWVVTLALVRHPFLGEVGHVLQPLGLPRKNVEAIAASWTRRARVGTGGTR